MPQENTQQNDTPLHVAHPDLRIKPVTSAIPPPSPGVESNKLAQTTVQGLEQARAHQKDAGLAAAHSDLRIVPTEKSSPSLWERAKDFVSMPSDQYAKKYAAQDDKVSRVVQNIADHFIPLNKEVREFAQNTEAGKQAEQFAGSQLAHSENLVSAGGIDSPESGFHGALPEIIHVAPEKVIDSGVVGGKLDSAIVKDYRAMIRNGDEIPPATITFDKNGNVTAFDGRHRSAAYFQEKAKTMPVKVIRKP